MPNPPHILNTLTKDQIQELRTEINLRKAREKGETKPCEFCGKTHYMRTDQKYCSARCRKAAYDEKVRMLYEMLLREKDAWQIERQELIKEIKHLKERLGEQA